MAKSDIINHVAIVVDNSTSIRSGLLDKKVPAVFDGIINNLKEQSRELNQQTRISIFQFSGSIENIAWDTDVDRIETLFKSYYIGQPRTALIDASYDTIKDMQDISEKYGDHAFLLFVITDGGENASRTRPHQLKRLMDGMNDNWTVACMVPDINGQRYCERIGFPAGCIAQWDTTEDGLDAVGEEFKTAMRSYMTLRSQGVRSTGTFFTDVRNVSKRDAQRNARELRPRDYKIVRGTLAGEEIRDLVERRARMTYQKGKAYYELVKSEKIQGYKDVILESADGKIYADARALIGLGSHDQRVRPGDHGEWRIFVQSTAVNRKIPKGSDVIVLK